MRKKPLMFCGFVTMMGIFGAFLHWIQTQQGFEADTGLAITNSPYHLLMIAYLVAFTLWLWWFMKGYKDYTSPKAYPEALMCRHQLWSVGSIGFAVIMILGSLLTLFKVVMTMRAGQASTEVYTSLIQKTASLGYVFNLILAIFAFFAAICFILFSNGCSGKSASAGSFSSIFIVIFFCYRLIATYKAFASDPVIWHFAIQILSVAACLLAWYFIAGFCYNSPKPRSAIYFSFLGAFLSIISCADGVAFGLDLISVGTAGMLLLISFAQLSNMKAPGEAISEDTAGDGEND